MRAAHIVLDDLPGLALGEYRDGVVFIDRDAAGHGWFVDATPMDDAEFVAGGALTAMDGEVASRIDLLSALAHELGHAVGFEHAASGVMGGTLAPGARSLPPTGSAPQPGVTGFAIAGFGVPGFGEPASSGSDEAMPVIDWSRSAPVAGVTRTGDSRDWLGDFLDHLGQDETGRNPNLGLKLTLPVAGELAPRTSRL